MTIFYPPHLRALFTDRERELDLLQHAATSLAQGRPRHLALFGLRRIGKTLLLLEHLTRLIETSPLGPVRPVYVDFEELVTSPELFSRRYIGLVCFWALTQGEGQIEDFLTPTALLGGPAAGLRAVAQTLAALESARDDPATQVTLALDFPEKLAAELDCRLLLLLDEFTELAVLGNYPTVRRPKHIFRAAMQRHGRLGYVIAASAISAMQELIQDGSSPLFLQFELLEISRFPSDATLELMERILGGTPAPGSGRRLHQLSGGHPFYIHAIVARLAELDRPVSEIEAEDVLQAFMLETLSRRGQIYNYCRYLYDVSLQHARGYGILKAILQVLAEEEGLTLSELARRIHKTAPTTRGYLRALQEVDIVAESEGAYYYRDAVLRYWAANTVRGIEVDPFATRSALAPLIVDLEARHSRLATELGRAKESQVREVLRQLAGRQVNGVLLGASGIV
ncbi:MAG: winged helix-turn-helix domain-containing protein, partial [Chloroflexi bacterium]|nr:winged helix-turn-helix domain-containing protein [Chloroflexota bacterium]